MDLFSYLLGRKSGGGGGSPGGGGGSENLAKAIIERSATEISDSTVTSIGNYAFRECKELTSAVFPNVTSIGDYAFNGCKKFTNMNLSKVNSYGDYALGGCTAFVIENLTFPIGTTIGQYAFNQVPIKGADLTNVSSIGKRAFSGSGLEYVYFPGHITPADGVLAGCSSLIAVDFADEITTIPYQCFSQSKNLERVHLPSELKTIEAYAFERCEKLVITEIPSKVTTIAHDAFYNCFMITTLTFKGKPSSIDSKAFAYGVVTNLTVINVPWAEGEVANAPWGAKNATINYNYTGA